MCSLLIFILCALLAITVESMEMVSVRGKYKIAIESMQTNCDHNYVEYFRAAPNQDDIHTLKLVKEFQSFSLHILLRSLKTQKIVQKISYQDGCKFLNNPFINQLARFSYRALLLNTTFKCPIMPGTYFLKNMGTPNVIPTFHPTGYYQSNVRIQVAKNPAPFILEISWKYNISHLK